MLAGLLLAVLAEQDSIPRLRVTYDVQADGTLEVTQRIDHRFSSSGRHGINFRIPSLDTSYWLGSGSAASMAAGMAGLSGWLSSAGTASRITAPSTSASSSSDFFSGDGSGGSSGFSSGASGGGGGGGTNTSSW